MHQWNDTCYFLLQSLQGSDWAPEDNEEGGGEHKAGDDPQHSISLDKEEHSTGQALFKTVYFCIGLNIRATCQDMPCAAS